jgi:hypothetical protein
MRKPNIFSRGTRTLLAAVLLGCLAACGSADNASAPTGSYNAKARRAQQKLLAAKAADGGLGDMVAAVSASKAGPKVELKFRVGQRPDVGQPVELDVALFPGLPAPDSIAVKFQVPDGLDIAEGADWPQADKPAEGTPLRHTVKLVPRRDGIYALSAVVSVDYANLVATRTFSIPLIVGEGLSAQQAKPEVSKGL